MGLWTPSAFTHPAGRWPWLSESGDGGGGATRPGAGTGDPDGVRAGASPAAGLCGDRGATPWPPSRAADTGTQRRPANLHQKLEFKPLKVFAIINVLKDKIPFQRAESSLTLANQRVSTQAPPSITAHAVKRSSARAPFQPNIKRSLTMLKRVLITTIYKQRSGICTARCERIQNTC